MKLSQAKCPVASALSVGSLAVSDRVCIGAIAGAYGVKGEVRLKSFASDPEAISAYGQVAAENDGRSFSVRLTGRAAKGALTARLSGIDTREQAEALRGVRLYVERKRFPGLPDDEYYCSDLIGLQVSDPAGKALGRVKAVLNHGASDILEIEVIGRGASMLLPFTRDSVPAVDICAGRIIADPPDGLL